MKFGAEGIGLCRTEHMFFEATRIKAMREMIVAKTVEAREAAPVSYTHLMLIAFATLIYRIAKKK